MNKTTEMIAHFFTTTSNSYCLVRMGRAPSAEQTYYPVNTNTKTHTSYRLVWNWVPQR